MSGLIVAFSLNGYAHGKYKQSYLNTHS